VADGEAETDGLVAVALGDGLAAGVAGLRAAKYKAVMAIITAMIAIVAMVVERLMAQAFA
jgi:hypothetical protein